MISDFKNLFKGIFGIWEQEADFIYHMLYYICVFSYKIK